VFILSIFGIIRLMEKSKKNYLATGVVVGIAGLVLSVAGVTGSTIVSAENGLGDAADAAVIMIVGGAILVVAAIIIIALLLFQD